MGHVVQSYIRCVLVPQAVDRLGLIEGSHIRGQLILPLTARHTSVPLEIVELHFNCAGSHKLTYRPKRVLSDGALIVALCAFSDLVAPSHGRRKGIPALWWSEANFFAAGHVQEIGV